eukprot:2853643-Rhodomonas_salina.2
MQRLLVEHPLRCNILGPCCFKKFSQFLCGNPLVPPTSWHARTFTVLPAAPANFCAERLNPLLHGPDLLSASQVAPLFEKRLPHSLII